MVLRLLSFLQGFPKSLKTNTLTSQKVLLQNSAFLSVCKSSHFYVENGGILPPRALGVQRATEHTLLDGSRYTLIALRMISACGAPVKADCSTSHCFSSSVTMNITEFFKPLFAIVVLLELELRGRGHFHD